MTRHRMFLSAAFFSALTVSVSALPPRTAPEAALTQAAPQQNIRSAGVHVLIGASYHAASIGF